MKHLVVNLCALVVLGGSAVAFGQQPSAPASIHASQPTKAAPVEPRRIEIPDARKLESSGTTVLYVDARTTVSGAMIEGAVHVPLAKVDEWAKDIDTDAYIVAYCACGSEGTSLAFVKRLQDLGFTNAYALRGGIQGWEAAGLPTSHR
jgi:rhodanese-related sulfurtransferase